MFDYQSFLVAPSICAGIGYFTNWLAIKMLFRPLYEKRLFGIRLPFTPGLIPKERLRLTQKMAETVGNKLLTADVLTRELASEKTQQAVGRLLDKAISSLRADDITVRGLLNRFLPDVQNAVFKPGSTVGEYLPDTALPVILDYIHGKLPDAARALLRFLTNNPYIDEELKKLTEKVIHDNLGRFIGFFLNPEKIYTNLKLEFTLLVSNPDNHEKLIEKIREYMAGLLERDISDAEGVLKQLLLSNGFLDISIDEAFERMGDETLNKLQAYIMGWINKGVYKAAEFAAANMDVAGMVVEKMNSFELGEAEEIILSVVHKELNVITMIGGVLGFIIGLAPGVIRLL